MRVSNALRLLPVKVSIQHGSPYVLPFAFCEALFTENAFAPSFIKNVRDETNEEVITSVSTSAMQ